MFLNVFKLLKMKIYDDTELAHRSTYISVMAKKIEINLEQFFWSNFVLFFCIQASILVLVALSFPLFFLNITHTQKTK